MQTKTEQRIIARYNYSREDIDAFKDTFDIGCVPNATLNSSGYDITVTVNGIVNTKWTYNNPTDNF